LSRPETLKDMCRKWLRYEPSTGKLYWNERSPEDFVFRGKSKVEAVCNSWNAGNAGNEAFTAEMKPYNGGGGYRYGSIGGRPISAHRVIWMIFYDEEPLVIDHINGDRSDNRIENLRNTTLAENNKNRRISTRNKHGQSGVDFWKPRQKWRARVWKDNKGIVIGYFDTKEEAISARKKAEPLYGYHQNHGKQFAGYEVAKSPLQEFMITYPDCDFKTAKKAFDWFSRIRVYNDIQNMSRKDHFG